MHSLWTNAVRFFCSTSFTWWNSIPHCSTQITPNHCQYIERNQFILRLHVPANHFLQKWNFHIIEIKKKRIFVLMCWRSQSHTHVTQYFRVHTFVRHKHEECKTIPFGREPKCIIIYIQTKRHHTNGLCIMIVSLQLIKKGANHPATCTVCIAHTTDDYSNIYMDFSSI